MNSTNDIEKNYQAQEQNIIHMAGDKEEKFFHIKNEDCVAHAIVAEPLKYLDPFLDPSKTWLTVGDYNGFEAHYLLQQGQNVVASDLSDAVLRKAQAEGLIKDFSKQNVERLTYDDNSFDYVMCKEAFHHFPRAYLGLYEMIRVSKTATILLTEPLDILSRMSLLVLIKNIADKINPLLINRIWKNRFSYETVGNYVFKISEREIEKIAMGMGLPFVAFKRYNMFKSHVPLPGMYDIPANASLLRTIRRKMAIRDLASMLGILPHGTLCCVLFKESPSESLLKELRRQSFILLPLPVNPYLGKCGLRSSL